MTYEDALACRASDRRAHAQKAKLTGIDFVDYAATPRPQLTVHLFGPLPAGLTLQSFRIEGGRRIREVDVVAFTTQTSAARILLELAREGDASEYTLRLTDANGRPPAGVDPRYAQATFSFKLDCPSELDCVDACGCDEDRGGMARPPIDYLAKDYASFRQLLLERLSLTLPAWREQHVPDLGIALVELMAYVGDHLSYCQDAVATEAYLHTARLRTSVRRHARLVDYVMHEGCNARAWVVLCTEQDASWKAEDVTFASRVPSLPQGLVDPGALANSGAPHQLFAPVVDGPRLSVRAALGRMRIYTWGGDMCCLSRGATSATLLVPGAHEEAPLAAGQFLLLEEVVGPASGLPEHADSNHRHVVRLVDVARVDDPLQSENDAGTLYEVRWDPADALPFALTLSSLDAARGCVPIDDVSVARGNVFIVDHGAWVEQTLCEVEPEQKTPLCDAPGRTVLQDSTSKRFSPRLERGPLTFAQPHPARATEPAADALVADPRGALPSICLRSAPAVAASECGTELMPMLWSPRLDLLASGGDDPHFVVDLDDEGFAQLRFGDGINGLRPAAGLRLVARYRVGNGPAGNVAAETITHIVVRGEAAGGVRVRVRNPFPAVGGVEPEPVDDVRERAPHALRARRERAVIAEDYAEIAGRELRGLERAAGALRWTGAWYEAHVGLDPAHAEAVSREALVHASETLERYRRIGHDLRVDAARYVPLALSLRVCAAPEYRRAEVRAAVLRALVGRHPSAFFAPEQLSFGQRIALSALVARVQAVPGVTQVEITRFERQGSGDAGELEQGELVLGPLELAQLRNDPALPEHGLVSLNVGGGR